MGYVALVIGVSEVGGLMAGSTRSAGDVCVERRHYGGGVLLPCMAWDRLASGRWGFHSSDGPVASNDMDI